MSTLDQIYLAGVLILTLVARWHVLRNPPKNKSLTIGGLWVAVTLWPFALGTILIGFLGLAMFGIFYLMTTKEFRN